MKNKINKFRQNAKIKKVYDEQQKEIITGTMDERERERAFYRRYKDQEYIENMQMNNKEKMMGGKYSKTITM